MNTTYEELKEYLPGLEPYHSQSYRKLAEIIKYQVLELYTEEHMGETVCFLPYMMNDGVESYLRLSHCQIMGVFEKEAQGEIQAWLEQTDGRKCLGIRQGTANVVTIWFQELKEETRFYSYHTIGHFWVEGQEQWRQLVYIAGTIYDKYQYLGESSCNEEERKVSSLMEFLPFRFYSPVKDSLQEEYPETREGILRMKEMAKEAGDRQFLLLLELYRRFPGSVLDKCLVKQMQSPKRQRLYEVIWEHICRGSMAYPQRSYGKEKDQWMAKERREVQEKLNSWGWEGSYPDFRKGFFRIKAVEEQPFTKMEAEDFGFRIQYMVSGAKKNPGLNSGFFKGKGNQGRIVKNIEELKLI